jgi:hypothetical protein
MPIRRKLARRSRDAYAYTPMTPRAATSSVITFPKYKGLVRDQIIRFSAGFRGSEDGRITDSEAIAIVNANEARIREAYENGIPTARVATSLMP